MAGDRFYEKGQTGLTRGELAGDGCRDLKVRL